MWHVAGACAGACGRGKGRGRGMGQGQGQGRGRGSEHRVSRRGGAGGEERERERSRGRKRRWTRSPGAPGTSVLGTEGKPGACHPARACGRAFTHCLIVAPTATLDVQHPFVGVGCAVRLADVHGGVAAVEADRALVLCLHTPHATRHTPHATHASASHHRVMRDQHAGVPRAPRWSPHRSPETTFLGVSHAPPLRLTSRLSRILAQGAL